MTHKLQDIDETLRTGICSLCGSVRIRLRDKKNKTASSRWRCETVYKEKMQRYRAPHHAYRKEVCEHCGFEPVHISQLDVDHIDGNNQNNDPSNLQTLCANCHRLKTHLNKDWEKRT